MWESSSWGLTLIQLSEIAALLKGYRESSQNSRARCEAGLNGNQKAIKNGDLLFFLSCIDSLFFASLEISSSFCPLPHFTDVPQVLMWPPDLYGLLSVLIAAIHCLLNMLFSSTVLNENNLRRSWPVSGLVKLEPVPVPGGPAESYAGWAAYVLDCGEVHALSWACKSSEHREFPGCHSSRAWLLWCWN